jgi:hypothetical protein
MKKYSKFINEKKDNTLEKILKFFNDEYIAKKAISLHPKLAIWMMNQFKNILLEFDPTLEKENYTKDDMINYMKTGKTDKASLKSFIRQFWNDISTQFQSIIDWSKSFDITPEERNNITKSTFDEAYEKSEEWHNSLIAGGTIEDESGTVLMNFSDGFYWIDLETTDDGDEADAMGHCGRTNKGTTLYSLRDRNKSPHITVAIDDVEGIIYQMKGKNNKKPISKYHEYIVELLINKKLNIKGFGTEYDKKNDFNINDLKEELREKLLNENPNISKPIFSDEDVDRLFEEYLDYGYAGSTESLIEWCYDIGGMTAIKRILSYDSPDILYDIFCDKYNNLVIDWINDNELKNDMIDFVAMYMDINKIISDYDLNINKQLSPANKCSIIYDNVGYLEMLKMIKKYQEYEYFIKYVKYHSLKDKLFKIGIFHIKEFDNILEFFIGANKKEQWKVIDHLINNHEYYSEMRDVFDYAAISYYLNDNVLTSDKRQDMLDTRYAPYVGEN